MKVLLVGAKEVSDLLPMADCVRVMEGALRSMARGEATFPPREAYPQPDKRGILGLMPGFIGPSKTMGLKAVTVFPGNLGTPYESHQGAILVFESDNGRLLGMVDAGSVTKIRTAAVSGLATELLSRPDSDTLAILGSGTQAEGHLEAILTVRPGTKDVRVWSRNPGHAESFVARTGPAHPGLTLRASPDVRSAVADADIVCTVTGSSEPILMGEWLAPGSHVNAVGASRPGSRELDSKAVSSSKFFVDSKASAVLEADDYRVPKSEGLIDVSRITELGDVLEGKSPGRESPTEKTVFKSVGLAVEDLASARLVIDRATNLGKGTWVDFLSSREPTA